MELELKIKEEVRKGSHYGLWLEADTIFDPAEIEEVLTWCEGMFGPAEHFNAILMSGPEVRNLWVYKCRMDTQMEMEGGNLVSDNSFRPYYWLQIITRNESWAASMCLHFGIRRETNTD